MRAQNSQVKKNKGFDKVGKILQSISPFLTITQNWGIQNCSTKTAIFEHFPSSHEFQNLEKLALNSWMYNKTVRCMVPTRNHHTSKYQTMVWSLNLSYRH